MRYGSHSDDSVRARTALACVSVVALTFGLALAAPFRFVSGDTVPGRVGAAVLRCSGGYDLSRADWLRGDAKLPYWAQRDQNGELVSVYGPAPAIAVALALPDFGADDEISDRALRLRERLVAALLTAVAAGLLCLAVAARRSLRVAFVAAVIASASFAGAATLGQGVWQQTVALPFLMAALASLAWRDTHPRLEPLTPAMLAIVVLIRPTIAPMALALGACWIIKKPSVRSWLLASIATVVVAVPFVVWNEMHFASPFSFSQWQSNARFTSEVFVVSRAQLGYGLGGLVFSPGRGLLWYAPIVLVGVAHAVRAGSLSDRVVAVGIAAQCLLIACFHMWWGGICFGPRFLAEAAWLGVWLAISNERPSHVRRLLWLASGVTVLVGQLGLWCWRAEQWETRRNPDIDQNALWDFVDSPIPATLRSASGELRAIDDLREPSRMRCEAGELRALQ